MNSESLLPLNIISEVDASEAGLDGKDLKRIARCDDGNSYAMKRMEDAELMPLSEWVGYHLCRRCGILTPDFAVLHDPDGRPPSFGSRIADYSQIEHEPGSFRISSFFQGHQSAIAAVYTLDAVAINPDRHARNLFVELGKGRQPARLRAFDFSRAWLMTGPPFGNTEQMRDSHTQKWWKTMKKLGCKVDDATLTLLQNIDPVWVGSVIASAPPLWRQSVDTNATLRYWETQRSHRIDWASRWLT